MSAYEKEEIINGLNTCNILVTVYEIYKLSHKVRIIVGNLQ